MSGEGAEHARVTAAWRAWFEGVLSRSSASGPIGALELRSGRDVLLRVECPGPEDIAAIAGRACEAADERERATYLTLYALGDGERARAVAHLDVRVRPTTREQHEHVVTALLASQTETLQQLRAMAATTTAGVASMTQSMGAVVASMASALQTATERARDAEDRAARLDRQASELEELALKLRADLDAAREPSNNDRLLAFVEQVVTAQLAGKDPLKLNGRTRPAGGGEGS